MSKNSNTVENIPLVSVSIITYNHENYIGQAIDSVLMQKVDFPYEIIIGDDNSKDKTREVLKAYKKQYPNIIQLILHPIDYDDIPGRTNNTTNLLNCSGKYIAMLDGDDFWNSPDKLQKQVDFLEKNPEYSLTFHQTDMLKSGGIIEPYEKLKSQLGSGDRSFSKMEVIREWFIQTSSMVYRNHFKTEFPDWFWQVYSADYALQMMAMQYGKAMFFEDIKMTRRYHDTSFTRTKTLKHTEMRTKEMLVFGQYFKPFASLRSRQLAKYFFRKSSREINQFYGKTWSKNFLSFLKYFWVYLVFQERTFGNRKKYYKYLRWRTKTFGI